MVGVVLLLALVLSLYWWPDSGFDAYQGGENFQRARTLWDWLGLLGVPLVLAVGGFAFSRAERKNEQEIAAKRARQEREEANKRADLDRELATNRAKEERERADDALRQALVQVYLDRMSELLVNEGLTSSAPEDLVRKVARARTLTLFRALGEDGARKGYIVQFLYEMGLIKGEKPIIDLEEASLQKADLSFISLGGANLSRANLSRASANEAKLIAADLMGANLTEADLSVAGLIRANLTEANLTRANLTVAYLSGADFSYAELRETDLSQASLDGAKLRGALLMGANLSEANLTEADLSRARVTNEQLASALSLEGATMPDGSKYAGVPPTQDASWSSPDATEQDSHDNSTS